MTTEQIMPTEADLAEAQVEETPKEANAELRAALKREKAKTAEYRGELVGSRLREIGLDPDKMVGKAIAKEYDGDMTVDAVSAFALEEYGYEGTAETTLPAVETGERLTQLESVSEPLTPPEPVDKAGETTAKMDDPESGREEAAASVAAKSQQFYAEHYGNKT
jgi:hypothetical protein